MLTHTAQTTHQPTTSATQTRTMAELSRTHSTEPASYSTQRKTGCHRFPLNNFKYFLTLFSKFFSSFPHGTCSLSVSRRYLALDEIYHPFRAALPNNSTRRKHVVRGELRVKDGILTLYGALFQKIYTGSLADNASLDYNSMYRLAHRFSSLSSSRFTRRY